MRSSLAALLLVPAVLVGQRPRPTAPARPVDLRQVRLGTDTLDLQLAADSTLRFTMLESIARATGADAGGIRQVQQLTGVGDDAPTSVDTVVVDAQTLRFRRSVTVRVTAGGREFYRATEVLRGGELISDEPADSGRHITRTAVPNGAAPLAIPNLVMRSAPLSRTWRPVLTFRIPSAGRPLTITVDSVTTGSVAGRRAWLVHANPGDRSRLRYAIDSLTRDLIEFVVRDFAGGLVSTVANRRYHRPVPIATTSPTAADVQRVSGHYYLEGVREVGSELLLRPDGTFEFMLAYGALDELGRGTWRMAGADVVLQSTGTRGAPGTRWFDSVRATVEEGVLVVPLEGRARRYVRH